MIFFSFQKKKKKKKKKKNQELFFTININYKTIFEKASIQISKKSVVGVFKHSRF